MALRKNDCSEDVHETLDWILHEENSHGLVHKFVMVIYEKFF